MITTSLSAGSALHQRILDKTALVGVIGLGYVGLPLVRAFISAGYRSLGYDLDDRKIKMLKAGKSYIKHLPGEWIGECVENGSFDATCDAERLAEPDVLLICVPPRGSATVN